METKLLEKIWVNRDIHVHVLRWLTEVHIFSWLGVEGGFLWTTDQHWRLLVEARVFVAVAELGSAQLTQTHAHDVIVRAVEETVHSPEDPLVLVVEVVHNQTVTDLVEPLEHLMGLKNTPSTNFNIIFSSHAYEKIFAYEVGQIYLLEHNSNSKKMSFSSALYFESEKLQKTQSFPEFPV